MLQETIDQWFEKHHSEVVSWRRHLHQHPELSHQEFQTTEFIATKLRKAGLEPHFLPHTGLTVDLGEGPFVAIRGDIDAIPIQEETGLDFSSLTDGVMHGCGHDVHTAIVLAVAVALAPLHTAGEMPMGIRCIFQPAEEVMDGGALEVIQAGGVEDVTEIYALHCEPKIRVGSIGLKAGAITSAADIIELTVSGPGGHTSRPHRSADIVFALGELISRLPALLSRLVDPRTGTVLTFGSVHAGSTFNAIPMQGKLVGTLRTGSLEVWEGAEQLVEQLIAQVLAPLKVDVNLNYIKGVPPVTNTEAQVITAMESLPVSEVEDVLQSSGGEDFSWYLREVPGLMGRLGTWDGVGRMRDLHQGDLIIDENALGVGINFFGGIFDQILKNRMTY